MRFGLECGTDAGTFVIFDPAALDPSIDKEAWQPAEGAEAKKGNLIAYSYGGDGSMYFRILVDEPIEAALEARAEEIVCGVLHVPTGRLIASGAEYLPQVALSEAKAGRFHPEPGAECRIPSGNYEVTALAISWGEEADNAADDAARAASHAGSVIEPILGVFTGMLIFGSLVLFVILGCIAVSGGVTLEGIAGIIKRYGLLYAAIWVTVIVLWRLPCVRKVDAARTKMHQDHYPGAIIHLRRLDDTVDISDRGGCIFGIGFRTFSDDSPR
jgi:hypothetical protein